MDDFQPCSYEEADTRILLHVKDAINSGYNDAIMRTADMDVVVLAVDYFQELENIGNLWIYFGTGKYFRYIPVHKLPRSIKRDMANGTISHFANHGYLREAFVRQSHTVAIFFDIEKA